MDRFEIFQNRKKLWLWRIVDEDGKEIARSRNATGHPGNCLAEIIGVSQIDLGPDLKNIVMPRVFHYSYDFAETS